MTKIEIVTYKSCYADLIFMIENRFQENQLPILNISYF